MRSPSLVAAFFAAAVACLASTAASQPTPALPSSSLSFSGRALADDILADDIAAEEITQLLSHGRQLESEGRWGEAILHYDDALRSFPDNSELTQKKTLARLHYDLSRRYADDSFRTAVGTLSRDEVLQICREVLTKIETHHVDLPSWRTILYNGTLNFEVALIDEEFLSRHLPTTETASINAFRRELRGRLDSVMIQNRADVLDAVNLAAWMGTQRLGLRESTVVLEYVCGIVNLLDDYSSFLTRGELGEVHAQIEGAFVGLGVELKTTDAGLEIIRSIPGSPAEQAGIRGGDMIIEVAGATAMDGAGDEAADRLQGPAGTSVDIVLQRGEEQPVAMRVRRDHVEVPSVEDIQLLDAEQGIGYFRMSSFQKTTSREMDDALWSLHQQGMMSLIIDLRGNPGGLLTASVEAADKFVRAGVIVSTRGRNPGEDFTHRARQQSTWSVPLTVLIDGNSASASEIFAGAIRDHNRGTIVGARSYGKGSVQGIFSLTTAGTGIRLTTAKFYSPNGHPFSKIGVDPDVQVRVTARPIDGRLPITSSADDPFIAAGLAVARDRMAQRGTSNGSR